MLFGRIFTESKNEIKKIKRGTKMVKHMINNIFLKKTLKLVMKKKTEHVVNSSLKIK